MKKKCLLGMLVLGLALSGCSLGNSPSGVVKDFYKYTANGKVNDAFSLITPEGQSVLTQWGGGTSAIAKLTEEFKKEGGLKSLEITSEQVTGDTATVNFTIKYGNGTTKQDNEKLIKQDGKWKITVSK